jgi:hypothetical protein
MMTHRRKIGPGRAFGAAALAAALAAGCGASHPTYTIGASKLTVVDTGYYRQPFFCPAAAMDQIRIDLVDFKPICGAPTPGMSDDAAAKDHFAVELFFAVAAHPNNSLPYDVKKPDCTLGPAGPGWAAYSKRPADGTAEQLTYADSGTMMLTQYDPDGNKPAKGTFDLMLEGSHVTGDFEAFACN